MPRNWSAWLLWLHPTLVKRHKKVRPDQLRAWPQIVGRPKNLRRYIVLLIWKCKSLKIGKGFLENNINVNKEPNFNPFECWEGLPSSGIKKAVAIHQIQATCSGEDISATYCLSLSRSLLQCSIFLWGRIWEVMNRMVVLEITAPPSTIQKETESKYRWLCINTCRCF